MNLRDKITPYLRAILNATELETAQREARLALKLAEKEAGHA